jgi:hypothetical protein
MTTPTSDDARAVEGDDQRSPLMQYGHGRMPLFMKLVWLAFLAFGAWYLSTFLLDALGRELAAR